MYQVYEKLKSSERVHIYIDQQCWAYSVLKNNQETYTAAFYQGTYHRRHLHLRKVSHKTRIRTLQLLFLSMQKDGTIRLTINLFYSIYFNQIVSFVTEISYKISIKSQPIQELYWVIILNVHGQLQTQTELLSDKFVFSLSFWVNQRLICMSLCVQTPMMLFLPPIKIDFHLLSFFHILNPQVKEK